MWGKLVGEKIYINFYQIVAGQTTKISQKMQYISHLFSSIFQMSHLIGKKSVHFM